MRTGGLGKPYLVSRSGSRSYERRSPEASFDHCPRTSGGRWSLPARRRACVGNVRPTFRVWERFACRVPGPHRSTRRRAPRGRADEEALTADIIAPVSQYGRYGYRRITALLRDAGRAVNVERTDPAVRHGAAIGPRTMPDRGPRSPGTSRRDVGLGSMTGPASVQDPSGPIMSGPAMSSGAGRMM